MKYFRWQPDFINTMFWSNYMLYMASIPREEEAPKEDLIVQDAADNF
jgi:hypothetical protein